MKKIIFLTGLFLSVLTLSDISYGRDFPVIEGPFLGQKPPGLIAEVFAPGIVSTDAWELEGVFGPDMKEFYFTTDEGYEKNTVVGLKYENNQWEKFIEFARTGEVVISADGNRMHMAKGYRERTPDGWSEVKSLGPMFDRDDWGIMRLSASKQGTYVFDDYKNNDVIRISRIVDGKRQEPIKLGPIVNSGGFTAHPYIAHDESYLIWDSKRAEGFGDSDLYISFRQKDGTWGSAINMGDKVNTDEWEAYATVTPDEKYITFNRRIDGDNIDIYWVDAKIIEDLRPSER